MGVGYGDESTEGCPVCPTGGCVSLSWDDFVDDPDSPGVRQRLEFRKGGDLVLCEVGQCIRIEHPRDIVGGVRMTTARTYGEGPGWVTKIVGPELVDGRMAYRVWYANGRSGVGGEWVSPIEVDETDVVADS